VLSYRFFPKFPPSECGGRSRSGREATLVTKRRRSRSDGGHEGSPCGSSPATPSPPRSPRVFAGIRDEFRGFSGCTGLLRFEESSGKVPDL